MAIKPRKSDADLLSPEDLAAMRDSLSAELGVKLFWGNDDALKLKILPLDISPFDAALGGGFAFDRMVLVYGEYSAGKTVLAMMAIKAAQARGLSTVFIDVEKTWTEQWATELGLDASKVLVVRPRTGEEVFQAAVGMVKKRVGVIVIDSLGAIRAGVDLNAPPDELFEKTHPAINARLINAGLTQLMAENQGTLIVCINQLRDGIGVSYGNPEFLPGGKGQSFISWQKVRVRRGAWIEEGAGDAKRKVGYYMRVKVEKNKQAAPFQEASVPFRYSGQFDELMGLIEQALELGIIGGKPPHYVITHANADGELVETKAFGRRKLAELLKADDALAAHLKARCSAEIPIVEV